MSDRRFFTVICIAVVCVTALLALGMALIAVDSEQVRNHKTGEYTTSCVVKR